MREHTQITDEMIETALITWFKNEVSWDKGMAPWSADQFRVEMRATLEAALSASPACVGVGTPPPSSHVVLAPKHTGLRVDYTGLLKSARQGLQREPGTAEMLNQLEEHLSELGRRWYDGDATVVDEFLQLYCIQRLRRDVLTAGTTEGQDNG